MKTVNLSLKIPEDIHQRFKIYSVLLGKSMSEIIIDYIETIDIQMPTLGVKTERKKATKTGKRKDGNPKADEELIKAEILKHKEAGMSLAKIADRLTTDGVESLRGGEWAKGTVDGLLHKWAAQGA